MPLGGMELLIILIIVLLFFGSKRIPELGRSLGRGMRELRKGASEDSDEAELREREKEKLPQREEVHLKESKESGKQEEENSRAGRSPG